MTFTLKGHPLLDRIEWSGQLVCRELEGVLRSCHTSGGPLPSFLLPVLEGASANATIPHALTMLQYSWRESGGWETITLPLGHEHLKVTVPFTTKVPNLSTTNQGSVLQNSPTQHEYQLTYQYGGPIVYSVLYKVQPGTETSGAQSSAATVTTPSIFSEQDALATGIFVSYVHMLLSKTNLGQMPEEFIKVPMYSASVTAAYLRCSESELTVVLDVTPPSVEQEVSTDEDEGYCE